jgi:hypothetical protein
MSSKRQSSVTSGWFSSTNNKAATLGGIYYSKKTKHPCIAALYKGKKKAELKKLRDGKSQFSTGKYQEEKANAP